MADHTPEKLNSDRYSRQILFKSIGHDGQERLRSSKVVILGCGALGTVQANLLARAGVGRLRIIDRDYVEESNLQRQTLFDESDAAQRLPKAMAAEQKLRRINSEVEVEGIVEDVEASNVEELVRGFDLLLDGTDNFETRFLVNDVAVKLGIPWIYGAVVAGYGVTLTIVPGCTACLSCILPGLPSGLEETCDTVGVIGPATNWVASIQAVEALKILLGRQDELHGKLLSYDIWQNRFQQITPRRNPQCHTCGAREFTHLDAEEPSHVLLCGRNAVEIRQRKPQQALDLQALKARLAALGSVRGNSYLVQFWLDAYEMTIFANGRVLVKGTEDPTLARSLCARYIGL
ncbi:MAG: ThiF family adenylyltransferase [Terriglobia bacterium]